MSKVDETVLTPQLRIFVMGERDSTKILVTGLHGDQDLNPPTTAISAPLIRSAGRSIV